MNEQTNKQTNKQTNANKQTRTYEQTRERTNDSSSKGMNRRTNDWIIQRPYMTLSFGGERISAVKIRQDYRYLPWSAYISIQITTTFRNIFIYINYLPLTLIPFFYCIVIQFLSFIEGRSKVMIMYLIYFFSSLFTVLIYTPTTVQYFTVRLFC